MSGSIGSDLIDALLAGLNQSPVVLGQVVFAGHEVPSRISVGGAHAVTIHKLPGGGRVIDAMGVDNSAISWSGFFTGPMAAIRARLVDAMRQDGQLVGLSFGDYAFNVVVVHFVYDLQDRGALISYRIRTEIVPDAFTQGNDTIGAIAAALSGDVTAATAAVVDFGLFAAQVALASVASSLAMSGEANSTVKLAALDISIESCGNALRREILMNSSAISPGIPFGSSGVSTARHLSGCVIAAGSLAASVQAAGYINRSHNWLGQLAGLSQGAPLIFA